MHSFIKRTDAGPRRGAGVGLWDKVDGPREANNPPPTPKVSLRQSVSQVPPAARTKYMFLIKLILFMIDTLNRAKVPPAGH